jgi:hypothetical protein
MTYSPITRGATQHHVLVWIVAKNRVTGLPEAAGMWTGGEDRTFSVESAARVYYGVGHLMEVPPIVTRAGAVVQSQELRFSATSPEVEAQMRGYDARLAPVEIHVVRMNPETGETLGIDRVFRGQIDKAPRRIPAKNETGAEWPISLVSGMRSLTRPLNTRRSDASQRARLLPGGGEDRFFRWADVAGSVERFWGTERVN